VPVRGGDVEVLIFAPRGVAGPRPAVALVHGAVDAGVHDERLLRFARAIAARGAVVVAPHLPSLAAFRMDPLDPGRIADIGRWVAAESGEAEDGRVSFAGGSVGGSYSILAADDPAVRDRTRAVLAFGAYADLDALLERWMTGRAERVPGMFDPLAEGRRLVPLGNVESLVPAAEVAEVRRRIGAIARDETPSGLALSAQAAEVVDVAASREPLDAGDARRLLDRLGSVPVALSPAPAAAPSARVYLLHGTADPVVPASDLDSLASSLRSRGVAVETHRTDLFEHMDTQGPAGFFAAWPLLRFFGGFLDDARM
jgi:dienelactone hydrolase